MTGEKTSDWSRGFFQLLCLRDKRYYKYCFTKKENEDEEDCFLCDVDDDDVCGDS